MFIDHTVVVLKAGDGGAGAISFRREKFVAKGGPDGGDGGRGGHIIIKVDSNLHTLHDMRYNRIYRAGNGRPGSSSRKTGKDGESRIVMVPPGTVIKHVDKNLVVANLTKHNEEFIACNGGMGGKGNCHFKSSVHQTPRFSQEGVKGEAGNYEFELKVLADVGLVGFPNAGKSTLLSVVSRAKPKIADYPFTTLQPNLGIVKDGDYTSFVMADIPGLIEGANKGKGLGHQFLKHIERTRILLYLIDSQEEKPRVILKTLQKELNGHKRRLGMKPFLVVRTKFDLIHDEDSQSRAWKRFIRKYDVYDISAVTGFGLKALIPAISKILDESK